MMKKIVVLMILLFVLSNRNACGNNMENVIDTTKTVFFLDGEQVYARVIIEKMISDEVDFVSGTSSLRSGLLYYGEKYRNGIYIYISRKKNDEE